MRRILAFIGVVALSVVATQSATTSFPGAAGWPGGMTSDGSTLYLYEGVGWRPISRIDVASQTVLGSWPSRGTLGGVAFDGVDRLFVADIGGLVNEMAISEPDDTPHTIFNSFQVPFRPKGIAFDGTNIYLHDWDSGRFMVTSRNGDVLLDGATGHRLSDLEFDPTTGNLWGLSIFQPTLVELRTDGTVVRTCDKPASTGIYGGIALVGSDLYIAEQDTVTPPGDIVILNKRDLVCTPALVRADAGPDQAVTLGDRVTLDGSGSSADGGHTPLTFEWNLVSVPAGSAAVLDDPQSVRPSFVADVHGDYVVELVVWNAIGEHSVPDDVVISTVNTAPMADAGPDRVALFLNQGVRLDGSRSTDDDGDALSFRWRIVDAPPGSQPRLIEENTPQPTLIPDTYGTYIVELIVTDIPVGVSSAPDTVVVSFDNLRPVADAGDNISVVTSTTVFLSGLRSRDPNGDHLTYAWSLTSRPDGSQATVAPADSATPAFLADAPGTYVATLIVHDGLLPSAPDSVTIQALTPKKEAELLVMKSIEEVNKVPPEEFKNDNQQKALTGKIGAALMKLAEPETLEATAATLENGSQMQGSDPTANITAVISQLSSNGVLGKFDGCATQGSPDRNDWITDCTQQQAIYDLIIQAIELLMSEAGGS